MDLKTIKRICIILLSVFGVAMLTMGVTTNTMFGYFAITVMGVYGILLLLFWRCPNCKKNLGPLWVKCCPNCGERIIF